MSLPLLCFDIDGTLVRTRGAGREALDEAFLDLHGWPEATEGVHVAGSTDDVICQDVARKFGGDWTSSRGASLRSAYLAALGRKLSDPCRTEVLPGLSRVLAAVEGLAHVCLLTGNWREGARVKLSAAGLWQRFDWGVFSEDAPDRDGLVPVARQRALGRGLGVGEVVVVGDTVADIQCARAGGARVVAVETGFSTPTELASRAPDLQVANLQDSAPAFLAFVRTLAG